MGRTSTCSLVYTRILQIMATARTNTSDKAGVLRRQVKVKLAVELAINTREGEYSCSSTLLSPRREVEVGE